MNEEAGLSSLGLPTHRPGWSRRGSGRNGSSKHPLALSNSLSKGGILADT